MDTLLKDLRYAVGMLARNRGFAAMAILSLALGIGANTSIFTVINAVLWRPLPFAEPDRLVSVSQTMPPEPGSAEDSTMSVWSYPRFEILRDASDVFEQIAAVSARELPITGTDNPERIPVEIVSASYFPMLGATPAAGRAFLAEEDTAPGAHPVAVVSHALWARRFDSDPSLVGRTIELNKVPLTVVGIMPEAFRGQSGTAEAWVPMAMAPALTGIKRRLQQPNAFWHEVIARLKPGVTMTQAAGRIGVAAEAIAAAVPSEGMPAMGVSLTPLREAKVEPVIRTSLLVLFAAVGFVLLIACVNIANLLLASGAARHKEIAIRLALGATRARVVRQLLTESLFLSLLGGVAAVLVSLWGVEFLTAIKPPSTSTFEATYLHVLALNGVRVDGQVLAFNFLLALVTGVLFGLAPALQISRPDVNAALKDGSGGTGAGLGSLRRAGSRSLFVVVEIALALVLLAGAGLMIRSLGRMQEIPLGFDPSNTLTATAELKTPADRELLLERLRAQPGVRSVALASSTPLSRNSSTALMSVEGRPGGMAEVGVHSVSADYFETLRVPVLAGRVFSDRDREGAAHVALVDETAARKIWPGEDPIGKRIRLSIGWEKDDFAEIVGVVGDVRYGSLENALGPHVYISYLQPGDAASTLVVRAAGSAAGVVGTLRKEVMSIDSDVPLYDVKTMEERAADATSKARFGALLLGVFACLALVLSALGVYGVMAHSVSGRMREIGIRMALGAQRGDVLRMVLSEGIALTAAGLSVGVAGALAATSVLSSLLFEVSTTDPTTFAAVAVLLSAAALLACYVPARRATRVDPMVALREQ